MPFTPSSAAVLVESVVDGEQYLSSGALISENQVLLSSHAVHNWEGSGAPATGINVFASGQNAYLASDGTAIGTQISAEVSSLRFNSLPGDLNTNFAEFAARDFAVVNLPVRANFGGSPLGWLALISSDFPQTGPATLAGYPYNGPGQESGLTLENYNLIGPEVPTSSEQFYELFRANQGTRGGQSGGGLIRSGIFGVSGVAALTSNQVDGTSLFTALGPGAIAQVEAWQSLNGNSPAARRLYRGTLGREPDDLNASSAYFYNYQQLAASALGVPAASAIQTYEQYPEAGPQAILQSAEWQSRYPALARGSLVDLLFRQGLRRSPTGSETARFADYSISDEQVVNLILNSNEATVVAARLGQSGF